MKKYQASKLTFEDVRPFMTGHYDDGVEDGMQRGLQKGLQQTALNALKKGFSLQDVADITSLSISELEELKSQL
jgi:predicted transposase/invertase (TIGR01784 family)